MAYLKRRTESSRTLKPVCLALGLVLAAVFTSDATAAGRPNIIIVMPDDVGYGDFACLGSPIIHTPNIDAFWKQSVRFTDFHVSPTCAPTRCALMTGRHEFKSGVTHTVFERERMSPRATTLAEVLKASGYATGIFGKWHLGDEPAYRPARRGFDETYIHGAGGDRADLPRKLRRCAWQHVRQPGHPPQRNLRENPRLLHRPVFRPGARVD